MSDEMRKQIIDFIRDEYLDNEGTELNADTPLISSGLVDSFSMVSLKMFIEDEYEFKLKDEEANTEAFDTVRSIMALVQRKLAEQS